MIVFHFILLPLSAARRLEAGYWQIMSGLWRPLAITVSFGLSVSLFVSLVLVPFASYLYYRTINTPRSMPT